jgi:hypothetical protein
MQQYQACHNNARAIEKLSTQLGRFWLHVSYGDYGQQRRLTDMASMDVRVSNRGLSACIIFQARFMDIPAIRCSSWLRFIVSGHLAPIEPVTAPPDSSIRDSGARLLPVKGVSNGRSCSGPGHCTHQGNSSEFMWKVLFSFAECS